MSEMLVIVVDVVHSDFYLNCRCHKRADVIAAQADGWRWGIVELTDPRFRIIKVFGYDVPTAQGFCVSEPLSKTCQARQYKLDIDNAAWPANFQPWLADNTRATPILPIVFPSVLQQMALLKMLKQPIVDPNP